MMTCPDCKANLDAVPVGSPCPTCGSRRRDATVTVETIAAVAHVFEESISTTDDSAATAVAIGQAQELSVAMGIDPFLARPIADEPPSPSAAGPWDRTWRRMEELAAGSTLRSVIFHDPGDGGHVVCEVRDEDGNILDAKPGVDPTDALLNVAAALLPTAQGDEN
jgi:hypothetical protein